MHGMTADSARPTFAACEWIFGQRPLEETIGALAAAGYDALVVVGEPGRRDVDELTHLLADAGLTVAGATSETAGNPTRDLAHPNKALRGEAVTYYKGCIDLVKRLGATTLGVVPSAEGRLTALSSYAEEWKLAVREVRQLAAYAAEKDVRLAIEPLNRYEAFLVNRVEQACSFASDVGVDGVGVIADLFHMNIEEPDSMAAIDLAGDRLLEIHLADSNREGLGSGHLPAHDLLERARASGFSGARTLAVECFAPRPGCTASTEAARMDGFLAQCAQVVAEVFS
jgi:D-psicose/D-tagatose/L-ribulose 3-epimerase